MADELFDIVDSNNHITGVVLPRSVVHARLTQWHRANHIWITNSEQQILCHQRAWNKDVEPGKWTPIFGGHVLHGETYEQSAARELKEELGIAVDPNKLHSVYLLKDEKLLHFSQVYVYVFDGQLSSLVFADQEVLSVRWLTIENLKKALCSTNFCGLIDTHVLQYIQDIRQIDI